MKTKKETSRKRVSANTLLWAIYIALLVVLLPHTAWTFSQFEDLAPGALGVQWGKVIAWVAAFAFEAAIAVFTHKLTDHNSSCPRYSSGNVAWRTFSYKYLNPFSVALTLALAYSALANFTHAVEFGQPLAAFGGWSLAPMFYSVTFGATLPACSLVFALVLSSAVESAEVPNAELAKARDKLTAVRGELRDAKEGLAESEASLDQAKSELAQAKAAFAEANTLGGRLFSTEKKQRILFAFERWPGISRSVIAELTDSSGAYVSEVLNARDNGSE